MIKINIETTNIEEIKDIMRSLWLNCKKYKTSYQISIDNKVYDLFHNQDESYLNYLLSKL